jgi:hypothetical protein
VGFDGRLIVEDWIPPADELIFLGRENEKVIGPYTMALRNATDL